MCFVFDAATVPLKYIKGALILLIQCCEELGFGEVAPKEDILPKKVDRKFDNLGNHSLIRGIKNAIIIELRGSGIPIEAINAIAAFSNHWVTLLLFFS